MLFVHQVHCVRGANEEAFERHYREGWLPAMADGDDGRLLWYATQAHGTGPSNRVMTLTAVRDGAAYEGLARRVAAGDLQAWARELDGLQHSSEGKMLLGLPWSPLASLELAEVPVDPDTHHGQSLYMEDTGWPHVPLDDYTRYWGEVYAPMIERSALLRIEAAFQGAVGAGRRPEAILWQKVGDHGALLRLLESDTPSEMRQPGTFMHDALSYRDQWESRLLRTSTWSPLW